VPADNKWFTRLVVSSVIVDALEELDLILSSGRRGQTQRTGCRTQIALKEVNVGAAQLPFVVFREYEPRPVSALKTFSFTLRPRARCALHRAQMAVL